MYRNQRAYKVVNRQLQSGNTALHIASLAGREATVKLLIEWNYGGGGANVNVQNAVSYMQSVQKNLANYVNISDFDTTTS